MLMMLLLHQPQQVLPNTTLTVLLQLVMRLLMPARRSVGVQTLGMLEDLFRGGPEHVAVHGDCNMMFNNLPFRVVLATLWS